MRRKMVHFTKSIQTLISDRNLKVKAHESIERLWKPLASVVHLVLITPKRQRLLLRNRDD